MESTLLEDYLKNAVSLAVFKSKLLSIIRPLKRTMDGIRAIIGVKSLTKLKLCLRGMGNSYVPVRQILRPFDGYSVNTVMV